MIFVLTLLVLTWLVWLNPVKDLTKRDLLGAWGTKVFFGIAFMYIHTKIYGVGEITVDWEEYFADSYTLRDVAFQDFGTYLKFLFGLNSEADVQQYLLHTNHWAAGDLTLMNDSRNVLRVNSILGFISNGNIYVHILFFAFASYLGFRELYCAFRDRIYFSKKWFWWLLFLLPSVGFWTSSVLKEPLMITGMGLFLNGLIGDLTKKQKIGRLLLGALLMLGFKPYVLFTLLIGVVAWFFYKSFRHGWVYFLGLTVLVITLIGLIPPVKKELTHHMTRKQFDFINVGQGGIHVYADTCYFLFTVDKYDAIDFSRVDSVFLLKPVVAKKVTVGMSYPFEDIYLTPKQSGWIKVFQGSQCGSFVPITPINNSYGQLLLNIPEAFWNAGFRPFIGDPGGSLKWVNIVETILLWLLVLYGFVKNRKVYTADQKALLWMMGIFVISLLVLIGWTTPILGAIVRYRMPAYLVLFLIGVLGYRKKYE